MKRIKTLLLILLTSIVMLPAAVSASTAGSVDSLNVSVNGGEVTVSGNTTGVLACAVCVYNEAGTELKLMESCKVSGENTYNYKLSQTLENGKYLLTVADYEGGKATSKTVEIKENSSSNESDNSKTTVAADKKSDVPTGDFTDLLSVAVSLLLLAVCAALVAAVKRKRTEH